MNRYITHLKRLIIDAESGPALHSFLQETQGLREKLSVILIQLQPSQSIDLERLQMFLSNYKREINQLEYKPAGCIEFRNKSWFTQRIYDLLREYNIALVFPSTPEFRVLEFTSNFAFIRIHGNKSYSDEELTELKREIDNYPSEVKEVYVYFNNDWNTYAIYNARFLKSLLCH
jgi:uncharacterized protein YecE (DUF72 family)